MQSQEAEILRHLKSGKSLTPIDALREYKVLRLAARVKALRDQGYPIRTIMETDKRTGKRWARYWMGKK